MVWTIAVNDVTFLLIILSDLTFQLLISHVGDCLESPA